MEVKFYKVEFHIIAKMKTCISASTDKLQDEIDAYIEYLHECYGGGHEINVAKCIEVEPPDQSGEIPF